MSLVTGGIHCTISQLLSGATEDCSIVRGQQLRTLWLQRCCMSASLRMFGSLCNQCPVSGVLITKYSVHVGRNFGACMLMCVMYQYVCMCVWVSVVVNGELISYILCWFIICKQRVMVETCDAVEKLKRVCRKFGKRRPETVYHWLPTLTSWHTVDSDTL